MQFCFNNTLQFEEMMTWFSRCKGSFTPQVGGAWTQLSRTSENTENVRTLQNIMKISKIPRYGLSYFENNFRAAAHTLGSADIGMLVDCMWCSPDHLEVMFRDPLLVVTSDSMPHSSQLPLHSSPLPHSTVHVLISYITTRYLPSFSSSMDAAVDDWKARGEKVVQTAAKHWCLHFGPQSCFGEVLFRVCCYGGISLYAICDNVFDFLIDKPQLCSAGFEEMADMLAKWKVKFWNRPELFTSTYVWRKLGIAETAELLFSFGGQAPERLVSCPIWKIGGFEEARQRGMNTREFMMMRHEQKNHLLPSRWRMYVPNEIWYLISSYA